MEKEFVPYNIALRLKALGFEQPCLAFYVPEDVCLTFIMISNGKVFKNNNGCLAPTYSQALRWFRDKHKVHANIYPKTVELHKNSRIFNNYVFVIKDLYYRIDSDYFETHEEAQEACLLKLLEIVEDKKD